ncbi:hypothetical protein J6590_089175 [Homalodisca vitripennis]|nr:hypothetical protein J6590_089175 [Homalodisca vitripennis]
MLSQNAESLYAERVAEETEPTAKAHSSIRVDAADMLVRSQVGCKYDAKVADPCESLNDV